MGLAKFIAIDPYQPEATPQELAELLSKMDGPLEWRIHPNGDVSVEYNEERINDEMIEDALKGLGFRLQHISDELHADEEEIEEALED
jgi:hypothetical protein